LHTEHFVDRVFAEYPNARIIHMARDPRDRYASVRKRHGRDIARVGGAMGRWLFSMRQAKRNLEKYPHNYMIVEYERLAQHPEETLRQVCAFIDEEYTPAMLAMTGAPEHRDGGGNSSFGQIEPGAISTRSIGRFRNVLSSFEIAFIQLWAGKYMDAFGYPRESVRLALGSKLQFYLLYLPRNLAHMLGWQTLAALKMRRGAQIPVHRLVEERATECSSQDNWSGICQREKS
jgi:hypothetical protein